MFLKLFISAFFALSANAMAAPKAERIVGGVEAEKTDYPFIVSLHYNNSHFCGGTLIKSNWVMTAAHCVSYSISNAYVGAFDQNDLASAEKFKIKRVIKHPNYNGSEFDNDFALLELDGHSTARPVDINVEEIISSANVDEAVMSESAGWGTVSEWGSSPGILRKVALPIVPKDVCQAGYGSAYAILDSMICAGYKEGGKDTCQGDSGGPLLVKNSAGDYVLAGVVSWGQGCARPKKYGVYSKINAVTEWINTTAK